MININRIISPDYENGGSYYTIEVTTDSAADYQETMQLLLSLQEQQQYRYKGEKHE
jgi:hypothetical protein